MMPPSNRDIMNSVGSKYAVVVGISKYARELKDKELALRAKYKDSKDGKDGVEAVIIPEAEEPLAELVNASCEDLVEKEIVIYHAAPKKIVEAAEVEENEEETTEEAVDLENADAEVEAEESAEEE